MPCCVENATPGPNADETDSRDGDRTLADFGLGVFTLRDGLISRIVEYVSRGEALKAVRLEELLMSQSFRSDFRHQRPPRAAPPLRPANRSGDRVRPTESRLSVDRLKHRLARAVRGLA